MAKRTIPNIPIYRGRDRNLADILSVIREAVQSIIDIDFVTEKDIYCKAIHVSEDSIHIGNTKIRLDKVEEILKVRYGANEETILLGVDNKSVYTPTESYQPATKIYVDTEIAGSPPQAHKDSHDPEDGSDALDSAAAIEISGVVAAGIGSAHEFARADHVHAINHGIADNHLVTMDSGDAANGEIVRLTVSGLESRSDAEMKTQLGYITDLVDDTTPQLGANLDLNSKAMILAGQTIDGGVSTNDLVYFDGTNWKQADADAETSTSKMLGIYLGSNNVLVLGVFTTSGLTAGNIYYVSAAAGAVASAAPSGSGQFARVIGYALSTTLLFFNPDGTWVEIT